MEKITYTAGCGDKYEQHIFADVAGVGAVHLHRHTDGDWVVLYWGGDNYPCFNLSIGLCFAKDSMQTRPAMLSELLANEEFARTETVQIMKAIIERVFP